MEKSCGSILVVDDDPGFRELVVTLGRRAGYACREAETGPEALLSARLQRPDVVLLDVKLGKTSGYQVCRDLRERFGEQLAIILVSGAKTDSSDRVAGLLLGADDYITKPFDPDELFARVGRAVKRSTSSDKVKGVGAALLTPREREVLGLLAQGLATTAISERLFISPKTVSTHVQRILTKLALHSRAEAIAFAYREGLVGEVSAQSLVLTGHGAPYS